jgi:peptidoglycan/LPS O-acetylase OafA/YrhL
MGNEIWEKTEPGWTTSTRALYALKWCLEILRPAILTRGPRKELIPTSYLDGLRGFAAFLVYLQHHQVWARVAISAGRIFENAYGYEGQYYFACLPFIRLFFTGGHIAVSVFFVISGHVLSAKPLALIHAGELVKLEDSLASAMFRRWLRLFIPALCTTFIYMTSWHLFGIWTAYPEHQSTYRDELWNWYIQFKGFSWIFRGGKFLWLAYNFHLWSIPVEFRGSIVIFTSLLAFSRCTRNARLLCQVGLIIYFMYIVEGTLYALFVGGMLLCDLDMLARNGNLPKFFSKLEPYKTRIFYALFIIGWYLSGVPSFVADHELLRQSPGWKWLYHLRPAFDTEEDHKWFYLFWAATFLTASIPRIRWLKYFFETRFCQYLGRISFAFYLIHGPVLWTLADRIYLAVGWSRENNVDGLTDWINIGPLLPKTGPLGLEPGFLLPHLIILPFTLWLAEMATKLFDRPSIRFAGWAYRKALLQNWG